MDITYTGAVAPTHDPVRRTSGQGCRTKSGPQRSLRAGARESLLEVRAAQLAARRRRTAWRSLRARSQLLDCVVLEPIESAEPCIGLAAVHMCEQLGMDLHATPHLYEEDGDE
jgi:hypothetical protein